MSPEITLYQQLLREDFYTFAVRCFMALHPDKPFLPAPYLRLIAAKLQDCVEGRTRRLIINVPPRHLKSMLASVALPAFWLGHRPSDNLMCVSYGQDLAEGFARQSRQIMQEIWYQQVFATRIAASRNAVNEFTTTRNGSRVAVSNGGVITGRGADLIILDDPLKPEDALSPTLRNGVNEWYANTLVSRQNNKRKSCIIAVMQRLHEMDLTGFLLENEDWEVLSLPAIAEHDEEYNVRTPLGPFAYRRSAGGVLLPEREDTTTLDQTRRTMGEYNFQSQYQQRPLPQTGTIINKEWFRYYTPGEEPATFDRIIQSWDTANKVSQVSDYSVCTTWGIKGNRLYLLHVFRRRMEFPELKRMMLELRELFKPSVIVIEDKASGTQLIQDLRHSGLYEVQPYSPGSGEKEMRVRVQTPTIEGGFVYLPTEATWLADYLSEFTAFPGGKHDDQVDSTVQFLDWVKGDGREPGMIGYLRMLARENHE